MRNLLTIFAKALGFEGKSLAAPDSGLLALFGAGAPTAAGVNVGPATALGVPAVSCAVSAISEAVATLDVKVLRSEGGAEAEVPNHPASALLRDRANDWTSGFEFIRDIVAAALLYDQGGLAWVNRVNGRPMEVIAYDPSRLTAQRHEDGTGAWRYFLAGREVPPADVIHLRSPFGRSPVSFASESIGLFVMLDGFGIPQRFPSIVFGEGQVVREPLTLAARHRRTYATLHLWTKSMPAARAIGGAVTAAVESAPLVLEDGHHAISTVVREVRFLRDPDGETAHGVLTVDCLLELAP
jgi:hypothetical protein